MKNLSVALVLVYVGEIGLSDPAVVTRTCVYRQPETKQVLSLPLPKSTVCPRSVEVTIDGYRGSPPKADGNTSA